MGLIEYKTLHRNDPEFDLYLRGSGFNKDQDKIYLPIETLNLGSVDETVTFQILKKTEIIKPNLFIFISSLIKLPQYILILLPFFYVLVKSYNDNQFTDPLSATLAIISMLFLFAGFNIRNDVSDHISGYDRVNLSSRKRPIALGWITAYRSLQISWIFIVLSLLISIPVFLLHRKLILLVTAASIFLFMGQFLKKNSYKSNRFGEFVLFLLMGPGLVSGYQISVGAVLGNEILAFGALWGFAILFLIHMNNFSHLLTSAQSKIKNTMTQMGFDRAQIFLVIWWVVFCLFWFSFHFLYKDKAQTFLGTAILLMYSIPFLLKILRIKSPLSSDLVQIRKQSYKIFLLMTTLFFLENCWQLRSLLEKN